MKGRKHRSTGGDNEAEADIKSKPADRSSPNNVADEAEKLKKGGRAKRAHGGKIDAGKVHGEHMKMHAGRKPRKSGGKTGSDTSPLTSAHSGKAAPGRNLMSESMD